MGSVSVFHMLDLRYPLYALASIHVRSWTLFCCTFDGLTPTTLNAGFMRWRWVDRLCTLTGFHVHQVDGVRERYFGARSLA